MIDIDLSTISSDYVNEAPMPREENKDGTAKARQWHGSGTALAQLGASMPHSKLAGRRSVHIRSGGS